MTEASITELRKHLPDFIRIANQKGVVLVMSHGKEVARIIPARNPKENARKDLLALAKTAKVGDLLSPVLTGWDVME